MQWPGGDESFRWTQPWGEAVRAAPSTTTPAVAVPGLPQPLAHDRVPTTTTPNGTERHRGRSKSPKTPPSPAFGCAPAAPLLSPSAPSEARAEPDSEIGVGVDAAGMPSKLPPGQEMDSFNPFQEEELAPVAGTSVGANTADRRAAVASTRSNNNNSGASPPPTRIRLGLRPAGSTAGGDPASSPRACGGTGAFEFPMMGSGPGGSARKTRRLRSRSPSRAPTSPAMSARVSAGTASAAAFGPAAAPATRSRSSSRVAAKRAPAGRPAVDGGGGGTHEEATSGDGRKATPRRISGPIDDPSSSRGPSGAAAAAAAAVGRIGAETASRSREEEPPAPKRPAARRRSASRDAPSWRGAPLLSAGYAGSTATPWSRDEPPAGRGGRASDGGGTGGRGGSRSEVGMPTPVGVTRRRTPPRWRADGAVTRSGRSPSRRNVEEDDDDDGNDSVGGPGLTVEAYMAKKRQDQVRVRSDFMPACEWENHCASESNGPSYDLAFAYIRSAFVPGGTTLSIS